VLAVAGVLAHDDATRTAVVLRRASNLFRALGRPDDADRVIADALEHISDEGNRRDLDALRGESPRAVRRDGSCARADGPLLEPTGRRAAFAQASLDAGTALALAGAHVEAIAHHGDRARGPHRRLTTSHSSRRSRCTPSPERSRCAKRTPSLTRRPSRSPATRPSIELRVARGQAWFASALARVFLCQGRLGAATHLFSEMVALFGEDGHPGERWGLGGIALAAGPTAATATTRGLGHHRARRDGADAGTDA